MAKTEMVFACHGWSKLGRTDPIGALYQDTALPIAIRETEDCETGFGALWDSNGSVEEFFEELRWGEMDKPGLWYVSVEYNEEDVDIESSYGWEHLSDCKHVHFSKLDTEFLKELREETENPSNAKWRWV
jgi:hypothetical protein